ncbi:MAG: NAD(P)H-hydrate dehydratase [Methylophilus sp.]|uniref:NAD(P)H-hydrate dehydratase n=1 Tax=Methylophilus sp. TaxID=29541 RepID=UPI003FA11D93
MHKLANQRRQAYNPAMSHYQPNAPALWQSLLPRPDHNSHKYSRGYVLIQGGYPVTGAARLAALAAARSGAGITAIAVPAVALSIYASQLFSIMAKPYASTLDLYALIHDPRIGAFLIGPGAGSSKETRETTLTMLQTAKPVVIDADALTAFARKSDSLKKAIVGQCVLTPHDGEFEKLFGLRPAEQLPERIAQALIAAKQTNATILLKGANTIIAAPDDRVIVNENAPSALATAGAGDVLAGVITGLLAQGVPGFEAAAAAVWLHSEAAKSYGIGLIADDLPGLIPKIMQPLFH